MIDTDTDTDTADRSNNIGIMLARLRLPPETIRQIVWQADDSALDVDKLAMVARMIPTQDEVSQYLPPCRLYRAK